MAAMCSYPPDIFPEPSNRDNKETKRTGLDATRGDPAACRNRIRRSLMPTFMIDFLIVLATLLVVGLMALMAWLTIILLAALLGRLTSSPDRRDKEPSGSQAKPHGS